MVTKGCYFLSFILREYFETVIIAGPNYFFP
jgi:hypothetical protein